MTEKKSLKRHVRARMSKTGERYTAARRQVLAKAPGPIEPTTPEPATAAPAVSGPDAGAAPRRTDRVSDDALVARTGRTWADWFGQLDAWGATARPHADIARHLNRELGVDGWWSQNITVEYEKAIGRRQVGQRSDGFAASASRTVGVPVEVLYDAFVDEALRSRWLEGAALRLRAASPRKSARFDWEDGTTRVIAGFSARGDAKSNVGLEHQRLADAETATRFKAFWRDRLAKLRDLLES